MKVRFHQEPTDPQVAKGFKVHYGPAKRQVAKLRWYLVLLVTSPLLFFLFKLAMAWWLVTAPGYLTVEAMEINSTAAGVVEKIEVTVGQRVAAGQALVRLADSRLDAEARVLSARLKAAVETVEPLSAPERRRLQQAVALAADNLQVAERYLETVRLLMDQGAATRAEWNLARERRNRARVEYDRAVAERDNLLRPAAATPADFRQQAEDRARWQALEAARASLLQRAPFAGRVLDIQARHGQAVGPGTPLMVLGRADRPYVEAYLDPRYTAFARKGRKALVRLPNGDQMAAVVRQDAELTRRLPSDLVSPIGSRDMMLLVRLDLEEPLPRVQWVSGLPVTVRFASRFSLFGN